MTNNRLLLAALGLLALVGGFGLYLFDRPATLFTSLLGISAPGGSTPGLGLPLSANLPSALHLFAFALLTVALLPSLAPRLVVTAALALGVLLELSQGPAGPWPLGSGVFDPWDLLACLCGALLAYAVVAPITPSGHCPRGRRAARVPALLVLAAIVTSVATSPPPPPAYIEANLSQLCPGSAVTLRWEWMASGQPPSHLVLVASNPQAITPSFERLEVEPDGRKQVVIHENVEFHLEGLDGTGTYGVLVSVIPEVGVEQTLINSPVCSGSILTWDPLVVSAAEHDASAVVETVTALQESSRDTRVDRDETDPVVLQPGQTTAAFAGQPFVGSWRIEPASSAAQCSTDSGSLTVGVSVRVLCEATPAP